MGSYDTRPIFPIDVGPDACHVGWEAIAPHFAGAGDLCIECYPGAPVEAIVQAMRQAFPGARVVDTGSFFKDPVEIEALLAPLLGNDPVFARFSLIGIGDFLDAGALAHWQGNRRAGERTIVVGPGAASVMPSSYTLVYVSMARWELQQRQRRGEITNLGSADLARRPAEKYRRAFFVDWRVGDEVKYQQLPRARFVIEMNGAQPQMIAADLYFRALDLVTQQPFRLVPFFAAGPWGGQ